MSGTLTSPHRLTLQLQKVLSRAKPDSYGRVRSSREDIDVNVGPDSVPRVLVFVDAFVKAAEERGFSFAPAATEYEPGLSIVINGQTVRFSILEGSRRSSPVASMNTARGATQVGSREFHPSGRLSFKIREYLRDRNEPTFLDRAHEPLERQLSIILHGLAQAAIELRERAEERAKEEKLAQERAEQHRRAEIQHKKLEDDLANWSKAETIRRFLRQVEQGMESSAPADPEFA